VSPPFISTLALHAALPISVHEERGLARVEVFELQAVGLVGVVGLFARQADVQPDAAPAGLEGATVGGFHQAGAAAGDDRQAQLGDRKSTRLNSSHVKSSYA